MGRLGVAFRGFFRALKDAAFAARVERLLESPAAAEPIVQPAVPAIAPPKPPAPTPPVRSDALSLLAVLQREGRIVDFLKESITAYSDAQIGAAVRDVHRDASAALQRLLELQPVMPEAEGSTVEVPAGTDAARVRLLGNVAGQPPYRGILRHAGWQATKVELPEWTGNAQSARVVAPAEVELS